MVIHGFNFNHQFLLDPELETLREMLDQELET